VVDADVGDAKWVVDADVGDAEWVVDADVGDADTVPLPTSAYLRMGPTDLRMVP